MPHILGFQVAVLLILLANVYVLWRAGRHKPPATPFSVSILVPARDEQANIERCVRSLLAQDYPDFEVLVLDDRSTDRTWDILTGMAREEARLRVFAGQPLPRGWLGKNWACAQLSTHAAGSLLLFTDADTDHAPQALRFAVTALEGEGADLLTGYPRQNLRSCGEKLVVPFFSWALYCFLPLPLAYWLRCPAMAGAIGQFLLFRRDAYETIGGHASVRGSIVEDLALARHIKRQGLRWRLFDATSHVSCRMYRDGREASHGLAKNIFAAFGFRLVPYLFVWLWLFLVFLLPPARMALHYTGVIPTIGMDHVPLCMVLSMLLWVIPFQRLKLPLGLAFAHPISLLAVEWIAVRSLLLTLTGRLVWKGRSIARPRMRIV
jgi:chlorobactene glucosyltransferase